MCVIMNISKRIEIKVIPNSSSNEVIEGDSGELIVRVRAVPEKGRANRAVIKTLEEYFNADIRIVSGTRSRRKVVEITER